MPMPVSSIAIAEKPASAAAASRATQGRPPSARAGRSCSRRRLDRSIGLDAHASSCTLAVVSPSGKRVGTQVVETNARGLIEAVRQIPEPRHICIEEGTLTEWQWPLRSGISRAP